MNRRELTELCEAHLKQVLRSHLPEGVPVYLFGSRVRGDGRWNSDYDLWIDAEIPWATLTDLTEELEESFIPFGIDLVTTRQLKAAFGERVKREARRWM
ncbi:MAG: nucleotidyltransferase family protein [Gammaproteobacteria bacterium]